MNKYNSLGKTKENKFAKGTLILLVAGIICKFIGAFYRIPLSNILGTEGIGVYQLIFPVYSFFLIFASGGIPIALSKIIAECRARGESRRAKRFLIQSIISLAIISAIFSSIFLIFARDISSIQGNQQAYLGYFAVAGAIIFASILAPFRGYFQGHQNMIPTAVSQIIEQVFKLILGLFLARYFMSYGITYGVLGAILGIVVGEILSLLYLVISYSFKRKKIDILEPEILDGFWKDYKLLIKKTLPITLNSIILPLLLAVDSFLIVNLLIRTGIDRTLSTQMFGVYSGMVSSLISLPTIVSLALATSLIPALSFNKEKGEDNSKLMSSSMKIIFFVSIPTILIFLVFSFEIMTVLYPAAGNDFISLGSSLIKISAINIFYISLLQITTAILQANNRSGVSLINLFFAGAVKVLLTIFLVLSPLGIYGAAVSSILCFCFASGLNLIALKNDFNLNVKGRHVGYIFISSVLALGVALGSDFLIKKFLSSSISVIISLMIAALFYLFIIILVPVFSDEEIKKIPLGNRIVLFRDKFFLKFRIKKT